MKKSMPLGELEPPTLLSKDIMRSYDNEYSGNKTCLI